MAAAAVDRRMVWRRWRWTGGWCGGGGGGPEDGVAAAPAVDRTMVAAAVKRRTGLGIERILETTTEFGMEAVRVCPLLLYWA